MIQNGEFTVYPGTRRHIGGPNHTSMPFESHIIDISKPANIYLFTDGYQDQFGDNDKGKFLRKQFKDTIQKHCMLPLEEQHAMLEKSLDEWQGEEAQTDDILVIGAHISTDEGC